MNWIDRKFTRENNLVNGAPVVWQKVLTAIKDVCDSFSAKYHRSAQYLTQNGQEVVVRVEFPPQSVPGMQDGLTPVNAARIAFNEQKFTITATLNGKSHREFHLDSNEHQCFIRHENKGISPDELSELALSDAFFKEPAVPSPQQYSPPNSITQW
jgi:hypothetical protein